MVLCPKCGTECDEDCVFCQKCGTKIGGSSQICPTCGTENKAGAEFCKKCGTRFTNDSGEEPKTEEETGSPIIVRNKRDLDNLKNAGVLPEQVYNTLEAHTKKTRRNAIIVFGVLGIIVIALLAVAVMQANSGEVTIRVHSTHAVYDVDVAIYVDGEEIYTFSELSNDTTSWVRHDVKFPLWDTSKTVTIKAVSYGGGLGSQTDEETIIVQKDGRNTVDLYI